MSDNDDQDVSESEAPGRVVRSRPSLAQVKSLVEFMRKHPVLAQKKYRYLSHNKFQKLWIELSNIVNSLDGAFKSTKGWIKFWSDKKRCLKIKQKQIEEGKLKDKLSPLELKILELSETNIKKKKSIKVEPCNGNDGDSIDDEIFDPANINLVQSKLNKTTVSEMDDKQINVMEKLVTIMEQQASAMSQMAQSSLNNAKALERLAEASHIQALAVDRISSTFENMTTSVHDVRNSIMSIDYTMKRCYTATAQHRPTSNLFS